MGNDKIEEKILKGCSVWFSIGIGTRLCGEDNLICAVCEARLEQHRETKKIFKERIFELEVKYKRAHEGWVKSGKKVIELNSLLETNG